MPPLQGSANQRAGTSGLRHWQKYTAAPRLCLLQSRCRRIAHGHLVKRLSARQPDVGTAQELAHAWRRFLSLRDPAALRDGPGHPSFGIAVASDSRFNYSLLVFFPGAANSGSLIALTASPSR